MSDAIQRFWAKVDKTGDCWEWTAAKTPTGYGKFFLSGKTLVAHRVAYWIATRRRATR